MPGAKQEGTFEVVVSSMASADECSKNAAWADLARAGGTAALGKRFLSRALLTYPKDVYRRSSPGFLCLRLLMSCDPHAVQSSGA